jgi:KDEL-tailed cysteine endopeptidase
MMKFILLIAFLCQVLSQTSLRKRELVSNDEVSHWREFTNFQERFSKRYSTIEELEVRFAVFRKNFIEIMKHNADFRQNFTMGVNQFTDLTPEEFKLNVIGQGVKQNLGSFGCKPFSSTATGAPVSIDWRTKGIVNPVRDQGQCGSCWAFATTANAESAWAQSTGKLLDFSEEYLVDCAQGVGYYNMGCNGGNPDSAFKYMIANGQCAESSYPYVAGTTKTAGSCHSCSSVAKFSACYDVTPNDQVALKGAVAKQPVAIAIEADTRYFQSYSGGILTSTSCGQNLDHAVIAIGFGEENGIKYWTVRNSWGTSWGEQGYVRILRSDSTNDAGVCGVAMQPSFITV